MKLMPFAVVLLALLAVVAPATGEDPGRVRANEATTVTVRGQQDPVEPLRTAPKAGLGAKFVSGVKGTAQKTWNGIVHVSGRLLNDNDDIPYGRERRTATTPEPR
jgi:hypothetical protein